MAPQAVLQVFIERAPHFVLACDSVGMYIGSASVSAQLVSDVVGARAQHSPTRHPTAWFPGAPPTRAQIEQLESICYWIRQLIALVCGLACGVTSTQGAPAFMLFGSLHMVLGAGVMRSSTAAKDASPERRWALVQEGLTASVGTFLVTWTLAWGRSIG